MSLSFTLAPCSRLGPRTGTLTLRSVSINTPGLMVTTSRGVVPHLSRDQHKRTAALRLVHVPFETFLENTPPTPTLQPGLHPLHTFLGFDPNVHLVAMTLRDPADGKEMPSNGHDYISASTARGVRKVTPNQWREYVRACAPDVVVALPDVPWSLPPFSQKRTTKSIERTAAWLAHLLAPSPPLNILVHMAGGTSEAARRSFSESLTETLHGKEAEAVSPHRCIDDGAAGYIFDLLPLRREMDAEAREQDPVHRANETQALLAVSLEHLSPTKLRVVNSVASPHEILRLIRSVGVDVFDAKWAQDAAHVGVALDFVFPIRDKELRRDLGHNLYRLQYANDFAAFSAAACFCGACAPVAPPSAISHSALDAHVSALALPPAYTRAYVHHLLHTHEMSAHALLVLHNLAVLDAFFAGVRDVLLRGEDLGAHADAFSAQYDENLTIVHEARAMWKEVDIARGKGRMARERAADHSELP
ncbi:tRNA-guanine(15) transglycosylase-like protein [Mycena maculata]|uniref:tRNA-guanine(15) transglycosylase-like protein n=1 Tax=Mycena maculata TaxID=230809 RepID=A0AAD7J2P6_9AGAR|nr:tRNA-guanine(15) transglycosylase-like protein [Mycena maculata]